MTAINIGRLREKGASARIALMFLASYYPHVETVDIKKFIARLEKQYGIWDKEIAWLKDNFIEDITYKVGDRILLGCLLPSYHLGFVEKVACLIARHETNVIILVGDSGDLVTKPKQVHHDLEITLQELQDTVGSSYSILETL